VLLILVDAMGGDNAPEAVVNGCIEAISELDGFEVQLIGDSDRIRQIIGRRQFDNSRMKIIHAGEVITNDDSPSRAIKSKKDSSMVVGFKLLKEKKGNVFLSAGNTGALMAGALLLLGRIEGVDRPALPTFLPTKNGGTLLIDSGINTVCKPVNYLQFGIMGSIYMKEVHKVVSPKVGLINNGTEEKKGTDVIKQAYPMLANSNVNFVGNVEARQLLIGDINVAVCDGFVGNVVLKLLEGSVTFFLGILKESFTKNIMTKLAALVVKGHLKKQMKSFDYEEIGGTPILGVDGIVFKSHGSSNAKAVKNAILTAHRFTKTTVVQQIRDEFKNMEVEDIEQSE